MESKVHEDNLIAYELLVANAKELGIKEVDNFISTYISSRKLLLSTDILLRLKKKLKDFKIINYI